MVKMTLQGLHDAQLSVSATLLQSLNPGIPTRTKSTKPTLFTPACLIILRWVKAGFYCGQTLFRLLPTESLWVFFSDKKSTIGFCFVSCYCIMVEMLKKGFHGNGPPCREQRPQIMAALTYIQPTRCRLFLITRQSIVRMLFICTIQNWKLGMVSSHHE